MPISNEYDWSETPPSEAVVQLVSVARDCDPRELAPLSEAIDPDALNAKLQAAETGVSVEFHYAGATVTLHGDGTATVRLDGN